MPTRRDVLAAPALALGGAAVSAPWFLPAERPFTVVEHAPIPMADGVTLSARLWLPQGGPAPAVLELIPYRKRDGYRGHDDLWGPQLAAHGIAYARVDVRGSGDSEGVLTDEYSEAELSDGVGIIAWLAAQPWCDGAVGMRGISWGGINTLQVAARNPPALKAIMPMGCCANRYTDDAHFIGGALGHTNFQWGTAFKAVMAGPPHPSVAGPGWREAWKARLEASPPIIETWLRRQRFDAYWQRGSVTLDLAAIRCPTYVVDGWDDTYTNAVDELLRRLTVPRKGLVGPWGHTYPYTAPQGLAWTHEEVRWWSHWLKGEATGIMDEPMLRAFMPYAVSPSVAPEPTPGRWIAEAAWPSSDVSPTVLRLAPNGRAPFVCGGGRVVGLTKPEWLDAPPFEQSADDAESLLFETAPLAGDVEILGRPSLRLRLTTDAPVAHVAARLTEVTPDGRSWLVAYALLNLTHRDSDETPAPISGGIEVDLPMAFTAHRFNAGSKVRIAVSESLWPLVWPSPFGATLMIEPDTEGLSLTLPVRPPEAAPAPFTIPQVGSRGVAPKPWERPMIYEDLRLRLRTSSGPSSTTPAGSGVTITRSRQERSEGPSGAPAGGYWSQENRIAWAGDGFDCRIEAGYDLTADETHFHVREFLIAREGETQVFERRTEAKIERDLM